MFPVRESFVGLLKAGEHIRIQKGFGYPETTQDTETVVASVQGNSALTVEGIRLCCEDDDGISIIPGEKLPIILTQEARELMQEAGLPLPEVQEPATTAT